jgi:CubicO group peptidase (beta-lactamase class C family)
MSIPLGAGGIVSTSSDLVFFINALFGEKILKKSTLETMKTLKDHYGMGLINVPFYKEKGFGHTGGIDAFWSILAYYPKSEIAFSITSNASRLNNNDIAVAILSATFNKPFEIPQFKTIALTIEQLDAYTGTFASQQIPLKITLSRRENQLISQATGQEETILEAIDKDVFALHQAGAVFEFDLSQQTFILKQNGAEFLFKKE